MLRPDGYVKVLDFGLARQAGADRADDELAAGTLGYMSPEEVLQRPITAASDIFSLGIVLYELASGTNPFRADSAGATTRLIQGMERAAFAGARQRRSAGTRPPAARDARASRRRTVPTASEVASRLEAIAQPRLLPPADCLGCRRACRLRARRHGSWRVLPSHQRGRQACSAAESASRPASRLRKQSRFLAGWRQHRLRLRLGIARDSSHRDSQCDRDWLRARRDRASRTP